MTQADGNADWIGRALSQARFAPYLAECGGDVAAAWCRYIWDIQLSMAFYPLLHFAEVALRNALHRELTAQFGRPDWWSVARLNQHEQLKIKRAEEKTSAHGRPGCKADDLVASLTFGFWVQLVSRAYDRVLWVPALHRAFPNYHGRRDALHADLMEVLKLRNRVMHHEPIHRRDLRAVHELIYRILDRLSPGLAVAVRPVDQVPRLLRPR